MRYIFISVRGVKFDCLVVNILNKLKDKREKRAKRAMDNIYKVLNGMMNDGDGLSEEMKKGILIGIELMGYQGEKWLDNEEHSLDFRNNTKLDDGWSGWKETYEHTAGFMFSEQPDENEMKYYNLIRYGSNGEELEEGEVDEDEGGVSSTQRPEEIQRAFVNLEKDFENISLNGDGEGTLTVDSVSSDEECYDSTNEEESDDGSELDDWFGFREITYENVKYLLRDDDNTVNSYDGPYVEDGIGVLKDGTIEFHSFNDFEGHLERVRESILPQNGVEVKDILVDFIKRNYPNFKSYKNWGAGGDTGEVNHWIEFRGNKKDGYHKGFCIEENTSVKNGLELKEQTGVLTTLPSLRDYSAYHKGCGIMPENLPLISLNDELGWSTRFTSALRQQQGDRMHMYQTKGKKLGDVMREIEKVYSA